MLAERQLRRPYRTSMAAVLLLIIGAQLTVLDGRFSAKGCRPRMEPTTIPSRPTTTTSDLSNEQPCPLAPQPDPPVPRRLEPCGSMMRLGEFRPLRIKTEARLPTPIQTTMSFNRSAELRHSKSNLRMTDLSG